MKVRTSKSRQVNKNQILVPGHYHNTFTCILEPKRISYDIRLFMQVHRKLSRTNLIEKRFEVNNSTLSSETKSINLGMKGRKISSQRFRRSKFATTQEQKEQKREVVEDRMGFQTMEIKKVNIMCNLDLYRRKYRSKVPQKNERKSANSTLMNLKIYKDKIERSKQNKSSQSLRT